jgi:hypothetical protein
MSPRNITHTISFDQRAGESERSIVLKLSDNNLSFSLIRHESLEGQWKQGTSDPEGISLYPGFTYEDKKRLRWRWDRFQHGGLIEVGIDTPTDTVQGRTVKSFFRPWFSLRGAKRFVSGQFRVAGGKYPGGDGIAFYELAGSSDTFQPREGRWSIITYGWLDEDDEYFGHE